MIIIISHTYIHYILTHSGEDEEGEDVDVQRVDDSGEASGVTSSR
jgi:hypothetical protein